MRKPRLILHIGLNKTGTSTIQHSLMMNDVRLREAGFHLPDRLGRPDGAHHLVVALFRDVSPQAFIDQIRKGNACPTTIVSAENFLEILREPDKAKALSEALMPYFETEIVLFLRRQDYLKESVFAQVVKVGFRGTIQQHHRFLYDFEPYIVNLELAFGRPNIKLIIYRDDRRFDSWTAFCDILGVRSGGYPLSSGNTNTSLPRRKTLALSMMRKPSLRIANISLNALRDSDCIRDDGIRWLMSPEERRQFLQQYLPGNRRICDRFALEGSSFFCSDEMPAGDWYPAEPIAPEEWAEFAVEIASEIVKRRGKLAAQRAAALAKKADPPQPGKEPPPKHGERAAGPP